MLNRADRTSAVAAYPTRVILFVYSGLCGVDQTLDQRRGGEFAGIGGRPLHRFGPVMRGRVGFLEQSGWVEAGQRHEELVGDPW
jgi:release factor glutamine methyltransferase